MSIVVGFGQLPHVHRLSRCLNQPENLPKNEEGGRSPKRHREVKEDFPEHVSRDYAHWMLTAGEADSDEDTQEV